MTQVNPSTTAQLERLPRPAEGETAHGATPQQQHDVRVAIIPAHPERLIRLPEIVSMTGLQKSSIYEMMGRTPPAFPKSIKLSRRAVCWSLSSVQQFIADRIKAGSQ